MRHKVSQRVAQELASLQGQIEGRTLRIVAVGCMAITIIILVYSIGASPRQHNLGTIVASCFAAIGLAAQLFAPRAEARMLTAQAQRLVERGEFRAALTPLSRAINLHPTLTFAYIARSAAYAGIGELERAVGDAEQAVRIAPRQPEARLARARLFSYRGLHEDAIRDLQTGIHFQPDWATGYLELAQTQVKLEDYDSGLATLYDLGKRSTSEQTHYDALILAGWIYEEKLQDLDKAIGTYTRAIPLLPDRKIGYLRRAYAYRTRGDIYQAAEDLLRAAQRLPTPEDAGQYHWLRAVCYGRRYTITGEIRDLVAWMAALQQSITDDTPSYSQQARELLEALRTQPINSMSGRPPAPQFSWN